MRIFKDPTEEPAFFGTVKTSEKCVRVAKMLERRVLQANQLHYQKYRCILRGHELPSVWKHWGRFLTTNGTVQWKTMGTKTRLVLGHNFNHYEERLYDVVAGVPATKMWSPSRFLPVSRIVLAVLKYKVFWAFPGSFKHGQI